MIKRLMASLGGEGFGSNELPLRLLMTAFFMQKVLGINRKASWPVHWSSRVVAPEKIDRGSRFPGLSMGCHIDARNGIVFGNNVWIGPRVTIVSMNHDVNDYYVYVKQGPVAIGENCWLAASCVVLPGVELGPHTIVAAGSVVTRSFIEGNQVLAGVPAKPVKSLGDYQGDSRSWGK